MRNLFLIVVLIFLGSCIDLISFDTSNEPKRLVVDATVTSLSYNERLDLPVIPELFNVRLAYTSQVSNQKDEVVVGAEVLLIDDLGNQWVFEDKKNTGNYVLYDSVFEVQPERVYKLRITTESGKVYESEDEQMVEAAPVNPIVEQFKEKQIIRESGGEEELTTVRGVEGLVHVPKNNEGEKFYRWKLLAGWEVQADLLASAHPDKKCWVADKNYFDKYILLNDISGNYTESIFFLPITGNSRTKYEFTVLINQYSLNEDTFEFWDLVKQQSENGASIFDPQPFQIPTNIRCISNPDEKVSGFFVVADESVTRWILEPVDIPFAITYDDLCAPPSGGPNIPPPVCTNCLNYQSGYSFIDNNKPLWWYETEE